MLEVGRSIRQKKEGMKEKKTNKRDEKQRTSERVGSMGWQGGSYEGLRFEFAGRKPIQVYIIP